jgi:hypothetical protein
VVDLLWAYKIKEVTDEKVRENRPCVEPGIEARNRQEPIENSAGKTFNTIRKEEP